MRNSIVWTSQKLLRVLAPVIAFSGLVLATWTTPAASVEITCIESSRYGYLYKLFGDDKKRFAAYFNLDPNYLPPPDMCRAAMVTGEVQPKSEDADKLIAFIAQNGGWLDTLYLDAYGTEVEGGARLAIVARAFWLKTRTTPWGTFIFDPDFGPPADTEPADPGRRAFFEFARQVATEAPAYPGGSACDAACTYTLVAGIDRHGIARLERNPDPSTKSLVMGLYAKMDSGDVANAMRTGPGSRLGSGLAQFTVPRYPAIVSNALLKSCKSDGAQLDDLSALMKAAVTRPRGVSVATIRLDPLKAALRTVEERRRDVQQCATAVNERARLESFRLLCTSGCQPAALKAMIEAELGEFQK